MQELLAQLLYGLAIAVALGWLMLTVGSLLVAMGSLLWFILHQKPVPWGLSFSQQTMKIYDDLGEMLLDERLSRTRKIFARSIAIFAGSLLLGAAYALLLKISNG